MKTYFLLNEQETSLFKNFLAKCAGSTHNITNDQERLNKLFNLMLQENKRPNDDDQEFKNELLNRMVLC